MTCNGHLHISLQGSDRRNGVTETPSRKRSESQNISQATSNMLEGAAMVENTKGDESTEIQNHLLGLRKKLDDAWWNEEPLETIQQLENEIAERSRNLSQAD